MNTIITCLASFPFLHMHFVVCGRRSRMCEDERIRIHEYNHGLLVSTAAVF